MRPCVMLSVLSISIVHVAFELTFAERPSDVGALNETENFLHTEAAINGRGRWTRGTRQPNAVGHLGFGATPSLQQPLQLQPASLVELTNPGEEQRSVASQEFGIDDRYTGTYTFPTPGSAEKGPYVIDVDLVAHTWNSKEGDRHGEAIVVKRGTTSTKIEGSHHPHDDPNHITIADSSFGFVFDGMIGPDRRIKGQVFEGILVEPDLLKEAREVGEFELSPAGEIRDIRRNDKHDDIAYVWSDEGVKWLKEVSDIEAQANADLSPSQVAEIPTMKEYERNYVMAYKWTAKGSKWAGPDSETEEGKFLPDNPVAGSYVTRSQMALIRSKTTLQDAEVNQYLDKVEADFTSIRRGGVDREQDAQLESSVALNKLEESEREIQAAKNRLGAASGKGNESALDAMSRSAKFIDQAAKDVQHQKELHAPKMRDFGDCKNNGINRAFKSIIRNAKALGEWNLCWDTRPDTGEVNVYFPGKEDVDPEEPAPCNSMGIPPETHLETLNAEAGTISVSHGPLGMCNNIEAVKARDLKELRFLSLQGVFINTFSAREEPAALTIGGGVPGEVFALPMVAGEKWMVARGSYAASTPNVRVSTSPMTLQNKIVEPGQSGWTSLSIASNPALEEDKYGYAFVAAMGHYVELKVPEDEPRHIDEDHVLAFPSDADFVVNETMGDKRGFLLSGEGAVLKYTAPKGGGRIMVQLRSLKKEAALMMKVGSLDTSCPAKASSLLEKFSGTGHAVLTDASGAGMRMSGTQVISDPTDGEDSIEATDVEDSVEATEKICEADAENAYNQKCCEEKDEGKKSPTEECDCTCEGTLRLGLRGDGEVNDVVKEEEKKPKIRLKRKLGLVLQEMALKFWGKGDEPLEECECASVAKDLDEETDPDMMDTTGLCLKQGETSVPENQVCFRLHRGEVEVVLKSHRASIAAEPGSAIFFTRPKDKGITTALSPQNNGMYQKDYQYRGSREVPGGDLLVQNVYELRHDSEWKGKAGVSFGAVLGGDVMPVPMWPGDVYYVRRGSYICGTANVEARFVHSFEDTLKSGDGDVFMMAVTLVPLQGSHSVVPGIFFVGVAAQIRLHRANVEQQLTVDSGMFAMAQAVSGRSTSRAPVFTKEWLGRGEEGTSWENRMLQGESMMMKFNHFPGSEDDDSDARDRIVFTQSINFGSYARKLIANMPGCPCWEWEDAALAKAALTDSLLQLDVVDSSSSRSAMEMNRRATENEPENDVPLDSRKESDANLKDLDVDEDEQTGNELETPVDMDRLKARMDRQELVSSGEMSMKIPPPRTTIKAQGSSIFSGEQYAKNASTRVYKLANGATAVELGLLYGAVALMVTAPPPTDGDQIILNGVGGSTVSYFAVDMAIHTLNHVESKVQQRLLSSSDNTWQSFTANAGMSTKGQIILTQTGAEDIMKLEIDQLEAAWKVKTGHVLATSDKVNLNAEWCQDENRNKTGSGEHGFMMMVLHHDDADSEERSGWIWGYGHLRHHNLADGEMLVLDEGHLVAMKSPMNYYKSTATGQFANYLGGDSLVFHFIGPGQLVSQSKNIQHYAHHLCTAALGL